MRRAPAPAHSPAPTPGALALDTAQRRLREDFADARHLLDAGTSATLEQVIAARRDHATHALAALESPQVLEFLDGLPHEARLAAVTGVAALLVGTPAAAALAQELFHAGPGAPGPLAARLSGGHPTPAITRLATALAPHLDATRGDALSRLAEVALGRRLSTREYVAVQDLATLPPDTDVSGLVSFAALVAALGEAAAPGGGLPQGARLLEDFHRAWQLREPDAGAWWAASPARDEELPVDWVASTRRADASAVVWLLAPRSP